MPAKKSANQSAQILQFKITLQDLTPEIWRRIQVPSAYTFWDLHVAIQDAMGWEDTHLHEFRIRDPEDGEERHIGMPADELEGDDEMTEPGWDVDIAAFFPKPKSAADYIYDFGDNWDHRVVLEAVLPAETGTDYPRCTGGERGCPPEDCGGPIDYGEMVAALRDPEHEEHASFREMVGPDFDPDHFVPQDVVFEDPKVRLEAALGDADDHDGDEDAADSDSSEPDPKALHATFREVVSKQLRENDPPETQQTYDRLIGAGFPKEEVLRMLSAVVACEMFEIVRTQRPHDPQQYVRWLENLPKLPFD